jgi:protein TonB
VLDDGAIRIVRMAAPYAPLPAAIRKEVDVLHIIRTWRFRNDNSLQTGN